MNKSRTIKQFKLHLTEHQFQIIVLLIALAAGTIYLIFQKPPTVPEMMAGLTKKVEKKYSNLSVNESQWPAQMGSQRNLHGASGFNVSSQSMPTLYFVMKENSPESNISPASNDKLATANTPQDAHGIISHELQKAGFKTSSNNQLPFVQYSRDLTTCLELYDGQQAVLTFSCYDQTQVVQAAQQLQPFVAAYNKANSSLPIDQAAAIGPLVIKSHYGGGVIGSSRTAGYDIAEAVVTINGNKKLVLFYHKQAGPWQYITQASDEFGFSCNDYKANADVRAAMFDQICLGDNGQVKLDSPERALQ